MAKSKKKRQKDGHKDPLLLANSKLQDEIAKQISTLRKAAEDNATVLAKASKIKEPPKGIPEDIKQIQLQIIKRKEMVSPQDDFVYKL